VEGRFQQRAGEVVLVLRRSGLSTISTARSGAATMIRSAGVADAKVLKGILDGLRAMRGTMAAFVVGLLLLALATWSSTQTALAPLRSPQPAVTPSPTTRPPATASASSTP
jgi:hypothetical protein